MEKSNGYLAHHGIKGQKWGVRRYQNEDGSLTSLGQQHREDSYTISAGSTLKRFANSGEPIDDKRKYVSTNRDDWDEYRIDAATGHLWANTHKPMSEYTYSTKKDLKVASGRKVLNDLVETYGDTKIKDLNKSEDYNEELFKFVKDTMNVKMDEIYEKYSKDYDAITDVEDWFSDGRKSAIILNPMESLKLESTNSIDKKNLVLYENQRKTNKTKEAADSIFNTLSKDEKEKLGFDANSKEWLSDVDSQSVAKRGIAKNEKGEIVSIADTYADYKNKEAAIAVATKNSSDTRGKGYGTTAINDVLDWYNSDGKKQFNDLVYWVRSDNTASIKLAVKTGFKYDHSEMEDEDTEWLKYLYK